MKIVLTTLSLLIALCCTHSANAQKAYDIINYQVTIHGNQTILQLADGYLLASKLTIRSKFGDQVFSPSADDPDAQGDLRFDAVKSTGRYKGNVGSWFILKKINGTGYPSQIKAFYWDGKMQIAVIFKHK